MNELTKFSHEMGSVRVVQIEGEPWFVGKDVAVALGYKNSSKAVIDHVDFNDKITEVLPYSQNGNTVGKVNLINESGLYSLAFSSKLPTAKDFTRWVTSEVLPSIRKTGAYGQEAFSPQLQAMMHLEMQQKKISQELEVTNQRIDQIRDVVSITTENWRKNTTAMLRKIAYSFGDSDAYMDLRSESYRLLDERAGVSLSRRLTNRRSRMREEGVSPTRQSKVTKLDVIEEEPYLIQIYVGIIKDFAIHYGFDDEFPMLELVD